MSNTTIKDFLSDIEDGLSAIEAITISELDDEMKDRAANFVTDGIRRKLAQIEAELNQD
ncbi:MAG: hypothetical protein IJ188_08985 [Clostridia bacterium]|nr:hypothetical protein [Clostridia bacterium]